MKKMVEMEYVGVDDVKELMVDALALMNEGHYVSVEVSNYAPDEQLVRVYIMLGGFEAEGREYDYNYSFYLSDSKIDVEEMNECKSTINNLLKEE